MKRPSFLPRTMAGLSLLVLLSACSKSDTNENPSVDPVADKAILTTFVDSVVLDTYLDLANASSALETAVAALVASPTEANFQAARTSWIATRVPWEQSESFLFGPVDSYGYDPALDSWPLDHAGLDAAIAAYNNVDVDTVDPSLKGFHAIEFILFGYDKGKTLASLTDSEKNYLLALTNNHKSVTARILKAWKEGLNNDQPFAASLKAAGEAGNDLYPSTQAAIEEMVEGMVGIADEVANNKIAQPFDQQDPNLVESQFSFNSLEDFQNNILSIRHVWQGSKEGTAAAASLSARVNDVDAALHDEVETAIDASLAALKAIPDPFRSAIVDPAARSKIIAAQTAIRALQTVLDTKVRAVLVP
ncbi:MAG TPA: imelysin family protein [Oligoflexus sp.]|uniref:imelysin family protein n=1 Tax=Oligoflexus sp. TaxID=1971216 RepID=UPI002D272695|nr:imelysin family protein [Oligoflexus sp.]HYX38487.1 imelysin family protein [Oligoflexus sp.]